jgi:hypothetical protein
MACRGESQDVVQRGFQDEARVVAAPMGALRGPYA